MKNFIAGILIVSITTTSFSHADQPIITPLKKNQPAPYAGVLFSSEASATIIAELESVPEKIKIEVDAAVSAAEAKKNFEINENNSACSTDKKLLNAEKEEQSKKIDLLQKDIKKFEENSTSKPLIFSFGFVGGIVFTLATVFSVSYIIK